MLRIEFGKLTLGAIFHVNGNRWMKVSSRTARLNGNGRVFYFGQKEIVKAEE